MVEDVRKIVINFSKTARPSVFCVLNRLHSALSQKEQLDRLRLKNQVGEGFFWSEDQIL